LAQFAADNEGALDVRTVDLLGQVERVLGIHHNQRFAHIWVKNPAGWQAFVYLNIPFRQRGRKTWPRRILHRSGQALRKSCKTLPYKPENARKRRPWQPGFAEER